MNDPDTPRHPVARWLLRRLTPRRSPGTYLALAGLLALATLLLFAAVAVQVVGEKRLTELDEGLGLRLARHREAHPAVRAAFRLLTDAGGVAVLTGLTVLVAVVLLWRRQRGLALLWVTAVAGGGLLNALLKVLFDRDRPGFPDPAVREETKSFPSGHSMGALIGYGLLAYLLVLVLPRRWAWRAVLGLAALVLLIGFSRLYLGAHYLSDVLGGFSVGAFWLILFIGLGELWRRVRKRPEGRLDNGRRT